MDDWGQISNRIQDSFRYVLVGVPRKAIVPWFLFSKVYIYATALTAALSPVSLGSIQGRELGDSSGVMASAGLQIVLATTPITLKKCITHLGCVRSFK